MKKIIVIICWFGKLPWYFRYFIHSCLHNYTIDFLIVTDESIQIDELPSNVFIDNKTIDDFEKLVLEKLNIKANLNDSYKLCDFKPVYGYLFNELIKDYDFWGHGDLDIIFGNIKGFINNEILENYDVISVRHDYISGFFTLFKNSGKINQLFKCSKDYKKVLSSKKYYCFDEASFVHNLFGENLTLNKIKSEIESMTHVVKKLHEQGVISAYFDFHIMEQLTGNLKWNKGTLTYKNKFEVMLYHLIKLKMIYSPAKAPKKIPDTFYISPTRIYT